MFSDSAKLRQRLYIRFIGGNGILCAMINTVSRPVEIGLHLTGIWPESSILFRLLWTLVMGTGLIFQYGYLVTHFSVAELPNLIDGLSTTLPYSLLSFKLITLWLKNQYVFFTTNRFTIDLRLVLKLKLFNMVFARNAYRIVKISKNDNNI